MNDCHGDFSGIRIRDVCRCPDFPHAKPCPDAFQVVLVPVGYENGLAVGAFDQIFQRIQFPVMYAVNGFVFTVYGTVCHLGQLVREGGGVGSVDFIFSERKNQIVPEGVVFLPFFLGEGDGHIVEDTFRHIQVVYRFHGNGDVGYLPVNGIFRTGERFVRIDGHPVPFVRQKVAVSVRGEKATEPFAEVKNPKFRP